MVAVIKILIAFVALTLPSVNSAGEPKDNTKNAQGTDSSNIRNEEVVFLAHAKALRALEKLEVRSAVCGEKMMETKVPIRILPTLPLSKREWGTVFTHLAAKAMGRCEEDAVNKAFMAFARFKNFEKAIMGDKILNTGFYSMELLCCLAERGKLETELHYMKIDGKIRETLEAIPELNEPFNPILTIEAMGN
ncbi:MAG: hypothetical protein AABY83_14515 [Pseudomonadota bacterium]